MPKLLRNVRGNLKYLAGFPDSSDGKESACNARDPGSVPGLGKSAAEWIGYPLQYSWASLVAQVVKNLPAMQETWVRSLGWEDPLEMGEATHSSILAWRIPGSCIVHESQRIGQDWVTFTSCILFSPSFHLFICYDNSVLCYHFYFKQMFLRLRIRKRLFHPHLFLFLCASFLKHRSMFLMYMIFLLGENLLTFLVEQVILWLIPLVFVCLEVL